MVLRKLSNGELIQIDIHRDEEGNKYADVYGVQWEIPAGSLIMREIEDELMLLEIPLANARVFTKQEE